MVEVSYRKGHLLWELSNQMLLVNGRKPRESGDCLISSGVQWRRKKLEEWTAETRTGSWMHGWRTRGSYSLLRYIPFTRPNCLIFLPSWHGGLTHVAHAHSSATRKLEDCGGALLKSRLGELFFSSHRNYISFITYTRRPHPTVHSAAHNTRCYLCHFIYSF